MIDRDVFQGISSHNYAVGVSESEIHKASHQDRLETLGQDLILQSTGRISSSGKAHFCFKFFQVL